MKFYAQVMKRPLDFLLALGGLILLAPVFFLTMLLVRVFLGTPIFFGQRRPGRHAQPFILWKFRTMTTARDPAGNPLPDGVRLTRLGRFLRATSVDELPELWNVLRGEMSLVGPRPLLMKYLPRYSRQQARRHEARPGITGWAQVNGRNAISWEEKFALDVWYVDHVHFCLDMRILLRTLSQIFKREGIHAAGYATMPPFNGNPMNAELSEVTPADAAATPSPRRERNE